MLLDLQSSGPKEVIVCSGFRVEMVPAVQHRTLHPTQEGDGPPWRIVPADAAEIEALRLAMDPGEMATDRSPCKAT